MLQQTDHLEEAAWEVPNRCRRTIRGTKPPQRYSPRFDKSRRPKVRHSRKS